MLLLLDFLFLQLNMYVVYVELYKALKTNKKIKTFIINVKLCISENVYVELNVYRSPRQTSQANALSELMMMTLFSVQSILATMLLRKRL